MPDLILGRGEFDTAAAASRREWLVTNGVGGFAGGSTGGILTRRYHGLLIAALDPPLGRTLLVAKVDETVGYDGRTLPLSANRWRDGVVSPRGYRRLEQFRLDGTTPVWRYAIADALLEKRLWMEQGANTTYLQYTLRRGNRPLTLTGKALVNYRDYHAATHAGDWRMQVEATGHGLRVLAFDGAKPFHLLSQEAAWTPAHAWHRDFTLAVEAYRGLDDREDHLHAGTFRARLEPGESITLAFSSEDAPDLDGDAAYARQKAHEARIFSLAGPRLAKKDAPAPIRQLILAADQFIVRRPTPAAPDGQTVIAGYPWFSDWGRDAMIALPGLLLTTGRADVARTVLRTFARFVDRGMIPNRFPDDGETPEYNTVDATLWFLEAIRAYHAATGDAALLETLFPVLQEIIDWHRRGTRYQIHVDPADGLLYAGEAGVQLTWMDAKVGDWVVTPRIGKPVEVNALWYNGLMAMAGFAGTLGESPALYRELAQAAQAGFARYWREDAGYCYDVLDGPQGHEARLRPNQLLAVSLAHSPLTPAQQRAVVDICARRLLTPHGLRSLDADDPAYVGEYGGDARRRDGAYHQGTVWAWLIGPFVSAHLKAYGDPRLARSFLEPLLWQLNEQCVGSLGEIYDGEPPHAPRGAIAQAWSVAEVLRAWAETATD